MRRKDRQISKEETLKILEEGEYGVLSLGTAEPYGVPLSYCILNNSIYFHCALEGRKLDMIRQNPKVSFCVVDNTEVVPEKFTTKFESCILQGNASEATGEEKQKALEALIRKYSPGLEAEGSQYIKKHDHITKTYKITIDSITGKAIR